MCIDIILTVIVIATATVTVLVGIAIRMVNYEDISLCRIVYTEMEIELVWHNSEWCYPNTLETFKRYGKVVKIIKNLGFYG